MSLIAWWPLIGDTNNYGTLGAELQATASDTTFVDGKIGKALYKGSLTITGEQWKKIIGNTISIAMWIYTRNDGSYSAGVPFFGMSGMTAPNNRKFSMFHYNTKTNLHCSWQNDDSNGTYWSCHYSNFFELNKWVHLCVVQDAATNTITVYRNGEQYSESTVTGLSSMNFKEAGTAPIRANIDYQHMNDIRIYDHALSQAEVKELSKALIVHYTFDDILAEPTTNVSTVSGWSAYSSYWTISEKTETGLKLYRHTGSTSDCVAIQNSAVTSKMAQGDIWTFSCYLYKNGQPYKSTASGISSEGYGYKTVSWESHDDGYYRITFQIISSPGAWVLHNYFFSPIDKGVDCEMRYMQFEKKDHATPYTSTSRESMLVNEAGYGGNGTLYNSSLSTDTASGIWSCHTPRINPNSVNTMVSTTNSAYVYADVFGYNHTPTEFTVAWWWKVIDWGYGTGPFGLVTSNGNYMDSTLGVHDGAVYVNFAGGNTRVSRGFTGGGTGTWTHFALTFKPGSYTSYINGVSQGTATTDTSLTLDPWRYLYLGAGCAGGCLRDGDIYWGDFRYYNTCLSDSDIVELYKTKAYITDRNDIMCGKFVEDKAEAMVTERSTFECKEIQEKLNIQDFELLDGILIEKNPYFDTGLVFSDVNTSIYVNAEVTPTNTGGNNCLAGGGNSDWNGPIMLNFCGGRMEFGTSGYSTSTEPQGQFAANERLTVQAEIYPTVQKWYKNNVQINNIIQRTRTTTNATFAIGTFKTSSGTVGATHSFQGYIHRFYVKYGNEVRCYLPAKRKSDNVCGLYDIHTKTFLVNSGGGTVSGTASTLCDEAAIYNSGYISGRELIEI